MSGGHAAWAMLYVGGLFLDAKYRAPAEAQRSTDRGAVESR
jgi:hypothetical protein